MSTRKNSFSFHLQPCTARHKLGALLAVAALLGSFQAAALGIVPVASRAAMGADDSLTWSGADGASLLSPYATTSVGGITITATAADLVLFEQNGGIGFAANFAPGDRLLSTFVSDGPITLTFSSAVRGVGFNIAHLVNGLFIGTLDFFNGINPLGSVTVAGSSSVANDGSAAFLGGLGTTLDITKVVISVDSQGGSTALTINDLSLVVSAVPEPTSALLLALGLAGLALRCRRCA
jgi:PEP-CTERM motif